MSCNLWENSNIGLPLTLYYNIEIPLKEFDTGHDYVSQPTRTSLVIEWIRFLNESGEQENNWKNLAGKSFQLLYNDETAEGSIYLGTEHCSFNSEITFISLNDTTFEIELTMAIEFNIDTINLDDSELVKIKTQIDFKGFILYSPNSLPSFEKIDKPLDTIKKFIDLSVYQSDFETPLSEESDWKRLRPKG